MGKKFSLWQAKSSAVPSSHDDFVNIIQNNRQFRALDQLKYGDHGLHAAAQNVLNAIQNQKRIALYADYDVDGTMSCVSWIWFFRAIGFKNYTYYIPDRFREGYGVNLSAVQHLIDNEKCDMIITMDTGITANEEAAYCKTRGVIFICTDHHKIQTEKMPDCIILNPKQHPDPEYQELCGCGITFVLLRFLGEHFQISSDTWTDILALVGMATICDVVPLNGVNHRLARMGVDALRRSKRLVLQRLLRACQMVERGDEKDVGFRLGPRINAVGRLEHAQSIISAFIAEDPEALIQYMSDCNERRKIIQQRIVTEADQLAAEQLDAPVLFLGGDWHPGVLGIAAAKIAEKYWRPTWLFNNSDPQLCKGSARSIPGFDVTEAMQSLSSGWKKFGGHRAAGGFSFAADQYPTLLAGLNDFALTHRTAHPHLWESNVSYDCFVPGNLMDVRLAEHLDALKPFGHGFEEPKFLLTGAVRKVSFLHDKQSGQEKHTLVIMRPDVGMDQRIIFFNEVHRELAVGRPTQFIVSASKNYFQGQINLSLQAHDFA